MDTLVSDFRSSHDMNDPRILFVHGLESRAQGSKTILLREQGLDVRAHDMDMGVTQISRKNSVVRMALRLPEVQSVFAGLALLTAATRSKQGAILAATLGASWVALRKNAVSGRALTNSFAACVEIQKAAVLQENPDIVLGSSWGGAVVVELIRQGIWTGPTILLAPAVQRVCTKTGRGDAREIARQLRGHRVIIFHDPTDEVVPFVDSEVLADEAQIELRAVDGGGHRLMGICHDGRLAAALRNLAAEANSGMDGQGT
jgi:hypothetical protein